ncbi:rhodanese-like domain-containing protein [Haloferula chungangensis]|uniref:Rhodanese-like domain-containing protein n=1 Tax=Haloferula chungangensis TaxID=1048331 RepID=A0ABW2LCG9_9BACT
MSTSQTPCIPPQAAFEQCREGKKVILDVRTEVEFAEKHLANSKHLPLDRLEGSLNQLDPSKHHYLLCLGGKRAAKAAEILSQNGFENLTIIDGGIDAWERGGLPVEHSARKVLPLMRQVQLVIGVLALTGSLLAIFINPLFAILPAFLGAGLTLAGSTGWCGLALLLARMPWNRSITPCGASCSTEP